MTLKHPKKPCGECPWRKDVATGRFPVLKFQRLANTAWDRSPVLFACHKTPDDKPIACTGFLLRGADHNLSVRLHKVDVNSISDGGYSLYEGYTQMAVANGVDPQDPSLARCRS